MSSCTGVRIGLLGVLALLATALTISEVRSQPRPPGTGGPPRPPSFPTPPRPPGFPGPPSMPGPPGAGIPGPPAMPSFPSMPSRPRVPKGGGTSITVWVCGRCDAELATGPTKPNISSCRFCGARFRDDGFDNGPGFTPPPSSPPASPPGPSGDPDLPQRSGVPNFGGGAASPNATSPPGPSGSGSSDSSESDSGSSTGGLVLKAMIVLFGLLFVLAIAGGICVFVMANRGAPSKRKARRSRPLSLDDDDDD